MLVGGVLQGSATTWFVAAFGYLWCLCVAYLVLGSVVGKIAEAVAVLSVSRSLYRAHAKAF